jgi:hypothetical protein
VVGISFKYSYLSIHEGGRQKSPTTRKALLDKAAGGRIFLKRQGFCFMYWVEQP